MRCAACFRRQAYELEQAEEHDDIDRRVRAMTWQIFTAVTTISGTALCEQHSLEHRAPDLFRMSSDWWEKEFGDD